MPYAITREKAGVYIRQFGAVDFNDLVTMQNENQGHPFADVLNYIIWDGSDVESMVLDQKGQETIAAADIGYSTWKRHVFHATVSASPEVEEICHAYKKVMQSVSPSWVFKHFKSLPEAREWLASHGY